MNQDGPERVERLQARLNALLLETPEGRARSTFSPYAEGNLYGLQARLSQAAAVGGVAGMEAALAEYERLAAQEDVLRMQYVLMLFLTESPLPAQLGLRIPSLLERKPWAVLPSSSGH